MGKTLTVLDVRRGDKIEHLGFDSYESMTRFYGLCRLYAEEAGKPFGSADAYWPLQDGYSCARYVNTDDFAPNVTTKVDEDILAGMIELLWTYRTGKPCPVVGVRCHGGPNGIAFAGITLPNMRSVQPGDPIVVIRSDKGSKAHDGRAGIVLAVDENNVRYVSLSRINERSGNIPKDAPILEEKIANVRFGSRSGIVGDKLLSVRDVCSPGDLLLRPLAYGTPVMLKAWVKQRHYFPRAAWTDEAPDTQRVIYRGRMRDCTGAETDEGIMFEHEGVIVDIPWTHIACITPID